jgi:hypothetical protein
MAILPLAMGQAVDLPLNEMHRGSLAVARPLQPPQLRHTQAAGSQQDGARAPIT